MRRRSFLAGLGSAALARPVYGQVGRPPARIGYLSGTSPPDRGLEYVLIGLGRLGYRNGRDFVVEERYADRNYARLPELVEELLRSRIDVMVVAGPAMRAAPLAARAGFYIDRILKGTHPNNLPIEQPTRIEMVANLRTSKAIGLAFPQSLMFRADEVIE